MNASTRMTLSDAKAHIERASQWSQYLANRIRANTAFAERLAEDIRVPLNRQRIDEFFDAILGDYFKLVHDQKQLEEIKTADVRQLLDGQELSSQLTVDAYKSILRQLRQRVISILAVRDCCGVASLEEVLDSVSYLAELCVNQAYRATMLQLIQRHGLALDLQTQAPLELIILGMGKLGGEELNISSDIDLIMLYPLEGQTTGAVDGRGQISHTEFFIKATQRIANILSEPLPEGFVFRVDLRLRPDGDGSALAWSLPALADYLLKQGREWERYAWLKARPLPIRAYTDSENTRHLLHLKRLQSSFVYRSYIDFESLPALRKLREQIREEWNQRAQSRSVIDTQRNIKLGEGGIREIEFIIQLAQLVRGGQMPSLRQHNFFQALEAEQQANILDDTQAHSLEAAYRFLRRLEHLLQYRQDQQTHLLPSDEAGLAQLAALFDMSPEVFTQELQQHRQAVSELFKQAFRRVGLKSTADKTTHQENDSLDDSSPTSETEAEQQQALKDALQPHVDNLLRSHKIKELNPAAKERLNSSLPKLIEVVGLSSQPQSTFPKLLDLIECIVQRSAYMVLLNEYPEVLQRVVRMIDSSAWIASYIINNPIVLDKLIDWQELLTPINIPEIMQQLRLDLDASVLADGSPDMELQMNLMRDLKKQITFQALAQDIEGIISVEHLADILSLLADMLIEESMRRVWPLLKQRHNSESVPQQAKFAVISYGRLGGKELGYESDLDLVFLFDDPSAEASVIYSRFARRLTNWLNTMTSSGRLYDIDTRLRPDGNAGLLAVSIDGFENYQLNSAWLWEHQALTRARFTAGDTDIGERFEALRESILLRHRNLDTLKQGIIEMRQRMHEGHPNKSGLFDLKHDSGGMVDIEFITQYIVLAYSHQYPDLLKNLGNIALLKMAGDNNLLERKLAYEVADIYRSYRAKQHSIRLQGHSRARTDAETLHTERHAVITLWNQVFPDAKQVLPEPKPND